MRENIGRLGITLVSAFVLVALSLTYWQILVADELNGLASNPRQQEQELRALRGKILDREGQVLAMSEMVDGNQIRRYPIASTAPITGYHSDRFGDTALEARFDDELRGASSFDGWQALRQRLLHTPVIGADVVTTLDARIQVAAANALGDRIGAVIVLDPHRGDILAMVSNPTFDAAEIESQFESLRADPDAPLLNRVTQSAYAPGSTFKLITATAAIDLRRVDLEQPFLCSTEIDLGGQPVDCHNNRHLPRLTYKEAFAWSSNRTFALTGLLLGFPGILNPWLDDQPPGEYPWRNASLDRLAQVLEEYAQRFGFEAQIPFDLAVEPSRLKGAETEWSEGLLAATAFGQGELSATPLQMALVAAAIANDGQVVRPYLVSTIRSSAGDERPVHEPGGWFSVVASAEHAQTLRDFMVEGVERGYASAAAVEGVAVGGKTGTAEVGPERAPHAWFIGFAPADAPRVAIAVIVENGGSGSEIATPIAGEILREALAVYSPKDR